MDMLEGGPWFIGEQHSFLKLWAPNLSLGMNGVTRTPKGLSHIASVIDIPLYMDNITESGERLEFAKVCIEIDSSAEFKEEFELEILSGEIALVKVEYAWKPFTCAWCNTYGHVQRNCHLAPKETRPLLPKKLTSPHVQEWRQVASKKKMSVPREVSKERVNGKKEGKAPKPGESVDQFMVLSKELEEKRDIADGEERKRGNGIEEGLERETECGRAVLGEELANANEDREERTPTTEAIFLNKFEEGDMGTSSLICQPFGNLVLVNEKERLEKEKGSLSKN
ncbi:uncharacterized protein LOC116112947 [Pistacia vera]|uniref:uncharacterized protein LOC116112947 n=1 Tax=Pistacia vera TaxID=55513 RepID=UPI001263E6CB|nr:uncharacterized protein LOC116112947 [Pistacia vera]